MLSAWLPWILAASMPVIAIALRLLAGRTRRETRSPTSRATTTLARLPCTRRCERYDSLVLDALFAAFPDPHPDLLAQTRPTSAQVLEATDNMGWMPAVPFLVPAVPARLGGV